MYKKETGRQGRYFSPRKTRGGNRTEERHQTFLEIECDTSIKVTGCMITAEFSTHLRKAQQ